MTNNRQTIRLKNYDYSKPGYYFVTVCTRQMLPLLGEVVAGQMMLNKAGEIVKDEWEKLSDKYCDIELDEMIVMPNHMHFIICITFENTPVGAIHELPLHKHRRVMLLPRVIGCFKMNSAKSINLLGNTPGQPVWQRNYYDHVTRTGQSLQAIREYIINNPMKWEDDRYFL